VQIQGRKLIGTLREESDAFAYQLEGRVMKGDCGLYTLQFGGPFNYLLPAKTYSIFRFSIKEDELQRTRQRLMDDGRNQKFHLVRLGTRLSFTVNRSLRLTSQIEGTGISESRMKSAQEWHPR
jgi:hypothetical protein